MAVPVAVLVGLFLAATPAHAQCTTGAIGTTSTFAAGGSEQCYVVPAGVDRLLVVAIGGRGGSSLGGAGGQGARVTARLDVTPGQTLYLHVGVGGAPAVGQGAGGGGASDVRRCSDADVACPALGTALDPRVLVAGGGGGGGGAGAGGHGGRAGAQSSLLTPCRVGAPGTAGRSGNNGSGGEGGTCSAGGAGGAPGGGGQAGTAGSVLIGGSGGGGGVAGGGGGGGLYGGGGGGSGSTFAGGGNGGGGGGGSSAGPSNATIDLAPSNAPSVAITPLVATIAVTPAELTFPATAANASSDVQTVAVENTGTTELNVAGANFTGARPSDYTLASSTCDAPLGPAATCELGVRFTARAAEASSATMNVHSDAANGAQTVTVSGTTIAPTPTPTPTPTPVATPTPVPTPTVTPAPKVTVALVTSTTRMGRDRRVRIQLRCLLTTGACSGSARLRTAAALGGKRRTLGTAIFQAPAGARRSIVLRVSRKNAARLRRARRTQVRVFVTSAGAAVTSGLFTLTA